MLFMSENKKENYQIGGLTWTWTPLTIHLQYFAIIKLSNISREWTVE